MKNILFIAKLYEMLQTAAKVVNDDNKFISLIKDINGEIAIYINKTKNI